MAGFGCCVEGGGTFGKGDKQYRQEAEDCRCSPFSIPDLDSSYLPLGEEEWPEWMARCGCSVIAILMHDQVVHKEVLDGMKVFTPANAIKFNECFKKCTGWWDPVWKMGKDGEGIDKSGLGTGDEFKLAAKNLDCYRKCKEEFMLGLAPITANEVDITASSFVWGSTTQTGPFVPRKPDTGRDKEEKWIVIPVIPDILCPPLCVDTYAVLHYKLAYKRYKPTRLVLRWNGGNKVLGPRHDEEVFLEKEDRFHHSTQAQVKGCTPAKEVCFSVQDYKPQNATTAQFCVGPEGRFLPLGFGFDVGNQMEIRPAGECEKLLSNEGFDWTKPGDTPAYTFFKKYGACFEVIPAESYISAVYIEPVDNKCPPDSGEGDVAN